MFHLLTVLFPKYPPFGQPHAFISAAVMKCPDESNIKVYSAFDLRLQSITVGQSRQGLEASGHIHSQWQIGCIQAQIWLISAFRHTRTQSRQWCHPLF